MDDPAVDAGLHRDALDVLRRLNRLAGVASAFGRRIEAVAGSSEDRSTGGARIRVLDVATGGGDLPCELSAHARARGLDWQVDGIDIAPTAIAVARERAARLERESRPRFERVDALRDELPGGYDVLICSLFVHHLSDEDAVRLIERMHAACARAIVIQDLVRSPAAARLTWWTTRMFSRNPLIRADGPSSVRAAFTIDEARGLFARAGLASARVESVWPLRWMAVASRDSAGAARRPISVPLT